MTSFTENGTENPMSRLSAADNVAIITDWTDLSQAHRSKLQCSVSTIVRVIGLPLGDVWMECDWLNQHLFVRPPAAFDLSDKRWTDVLSDLRFILERLGRHAKRQRGKDGLSPEWLALWDLLPERVLRARMS